MSDQSNNDGKTVRNPETEIGTDYVNVYKRGRAGGGRDDEHGGLPSVNTEQNERDEFYDVDDYPELSLTDNSAFVNVPKNFEKSTIEDYLSEIPELFKNANLLDACRIQHYVMNAFEICLEDALKEHTETKSKTVLDFAASESKTVDKAMVMQYLLNFNAIDDQLSNVRLNVTHEDVVDDHIMEDNVEAIRPQSAEEVIQQLFAKNIELEREDDLYELLLNDNDETLEAVHQQQNNQQQAKAQQVQPNRHPYFLRKRYETPTREPSVDSSSAIQFFTNARRHPTEHEMLLRRPFPKRVFRDIPTEALPSTGGRNWSISYCELPLAEFELGTFILQRQRADDIEINNARDDHFDGVEIARQFSTNRTAGEQLTQLPTFRSTPLAIGSVYLSSFDNSSLVRSNEPPEKPLTSDGDVMTAPQMLGYFFIIIFCILLSLFVCFLEHLTLK